MAAGILTGSDGRVLVAQRPEGKPQAGAWEFPGGKLHTGEMPLAGLTRELQEELAVRIVLARHLVRYSHDYPDKRVHLYIWRILSWSGEPRGAEGQSLAWVAVKDLLAHGLLPADEPVVKLLQKESAVNSATVESCWQPSADG
ncbi:MAG: 8-oxo-dGTP diphosphatase MutT [Gammaproteobacteria bacterium]|nr:8-oxo-dGTP diphosphatase MutT [Gammaproteobacteria bacterium]